MENSIPNLSNQSNQISSEPENYLCSHDNHIILRSYNANDKSGSEVAPEVSAVGKKPVSNDVKESIADKEPAVEPALQPAEQVDTSRSKRDVVDGIAKKVNPGSVSIFRASFKLFRD